MTTKTFETQADFSFVMDIAKSFAQVETVGDVTTTTMFIKGVASSTRRDLQGDRFSREGLENIKKSIEEGIDNGDGSYSRIPLRSGHRAEWEDVLGEVVKAEIDAEDNLWITAQLDEDSYKAQELYRKLSKGKVKLGLSVKGTVTRYALEWDHEVQKSSPVFHNLLTKEISVTQQPVNPSPYPLAIAKSLLADPNYSHALEESMSTEITKSADDEVVHPALADNNTELKNVEGEHAQEQNEVAADTANLTLDETNTEQVVENTTIDAPAAPAEPQRVSETPAEDSNANDVPDGYVAAPNSSSVTQEETPAEEVVSTDPVAAASDPVDKLSSQLDSVLELVQNLKGEVESLKNKPVEAQKALEADPATPEADLDTRIAVAVTKAMESLGFTPAVVQEIQAVKSQVEELASQPLDRSISVSKAKDPEDYNDPMVRFASLKESGLNPIMAALNASRTDKK